MFNKKKKIIFAYEKYCQKLEDDLQSKSQRIKELETEIAYANLDSMRYKEENYMLKNNLDI